MDTANELLSPYLNADGIHELFSGDTELDLLAQTLSPQIALLLLKHFSGCELKIAKNLKPNSWVAQQIGFETAQQLADYLGGEVISVPLRHPAQKTVLEHRIRSLVEAGKTRGEIAGEVGMSQRNIRRITSRLGLSGVTKAKCCTRSRRKSSQSVFNGGLTGVSANSTTPNPPKPCFAAQRPILSKYGIYSPQRQKDIA